ncbi:MAG: hypothetical protein ACHQ51_14770 [Elusimicrobiota bacterium]
MRKTAQLSLLLALLAAPSRAATVRVEPLADAAAVSAPTAVAPVSLSPLSVSIAPFAASVAPAPLVAVPVAAPLAAPVPAAAPALLPAAILPAASAPSRAPALPALPSAAAPDSKDGPAAVDAGRALFDRAAAPAQPISEIVSANAGRPLREGVFIQQEHEGSLLAPDPRDSSGNIFRYYRPIELRPDLAAETERGLGGFSRLVYSVRRAFQIQGRGTPEAAWRAWPQSAKLDYLDRLERAVTAERGPTAAWDGKVSLILERGPKAPDFVTKNPHMEAPPAPYRGTVGARFLQPEIVTAKDKPALSVNEALGRAKVVIADTGHAGVQFHVFVKAEPKVLLAQMDRLGSALQLVNDVLFAKAAAESEKNLIHSSLMPWHAGRTARVRELLEKARNAPSVPEAEDPDSEKHAFVGMRYWGMEDGKAVVSFELRGASLPFKRAANTGAREMETPKMPERDYGQARSYLTFLSVYAEALARGEAPPLAAAPIALDQAAADAYLNARAKALGVPDGAFDGLGPLVKRLIRSDKVAPGLLFPFAASPADSPELIALADRIITLGARVKAAEESAHEGNPRHEGYLFWTAYADWASRYGAKQDARLADLVRAAAR